MIKEKASVRANWCSNARNKNLLCVTYCFLLIDWFQDRAYSFPGQAYNISPPSPPFHLLLPLSCPPFPFCPLLHLFLSFFHHALLTVWDTKQWNWTRRELNKTLQVWKPTSSLSTRVHNDVIFIEHDIIMRSPQYRRVIMRSCSQTCMYSTGAANGAKPSARARTLVKTEGECFVQFIVWTLSMST